MDGWVHGRVDRWLVALVGEQMDEKWLLNGWVGRMTGWSGPWMSG